MSLKSKLLATSALLGLSAIPALAQITPEQVAAAYADYDAVEVKTGPTQIKVEAYRGGRKLEVIYDIATGEILASETYNDSPDDEDMGVDFDFEDEDFLDDEDDEDDEDDDDEDDEDDDDDEDDEDDDDEDDDDEDDDDEDDDDEDDDED